MSNELIAILVVGVLLAVGELMTFALSYRALRAMDRTHDEALREISRGQQEIGRTQRVVAALIIQESEKIRKLLQPEG